MTAAKRGASFENARSGAGMRTGRALERHLQEHIVAGHVATAPRAPFVPSGRALDAPTAGRMADVRGRDGGRLGGVALSVGCNLSVGKFSKFRPES